MSSQKNDTVSDYYSGQGVVLIGVTDSVTGLLKYYEPLGNVSDLKITTQTSVLEHKNAQDGQRAVDKRITTETKVNMSLTLDNWIAQNLALALRGDAATVAGATVTAVALTAYLGKVQSLPQINCSALSLKQGATTLDQYVDDATPWDYKANLEAGSVKTNDNVLTMSKLGVAATAITIGATTSITVPNNLAVGEPASLRGFTGADAADVNGKTFVAAAGTNSTTLVIALNTTGKTITATGTPKVAWSGMALAVDYTYSDQKLVNSLTRPLAEVALRFEGLNTADSNSPVIVEVYKFSTDPLKELALLSDTYGSFVLEGSVLADGTKASGSKYFQVKKLK